MYLKMSSAKWWPFCPEEEELTSRVLVTYTYVSELGQHWHKQWLGAWAPFQYEYRLSRFGYLHVKDKTVTRPSCVLHGDHYTDKTASLYWDGPLSGINEQMCTCHDLEQNSAEVESKCKPRNNFHFQSAKQNHFSWVNAALIKDMEL